MNSESLTEELAEWMHSLSMPQRITALALMYSHLTVATRELFLSQTTKGKEHIILELLHGVNEMHHTLANSLLRWGNGEEDWTPEALNQQLVGIGKQYRILHLLKSIVDFARSRDIWGADGQ